MPIELLGIIWIFNYTRIHISVSDNIVLAMCKRECLNGMIHPREYSIRKEEEEDKQILHQFFSFSDKGKKKLGVLIKVSVLVVLAAFVTRLPCVCLIWDF